MSTLTITDLHASVTTPDGSEKEILKGVNLTVNSGETHAVMGPNGSGKSTLSYAIAGHPKYHVTSGSITPDGQDLPTMDVGQPPPRGFFPAIPDPLRGPGGSRSGARACRRASSMSTTTAVAA